MTARCTRSRAKARMNYRQRRMFSRWLGCCFGLHDTYSPTLWFAVQKATRQTDRPLLHDWKLARRVARYLKGTGRKTRHETKRKYEYVDCAKKSRRRRFRHGQEWQEVSDRRYTSKRCGGQLERQETGWRIAIDDESRTCSGVGGCLKNFTRARNVMQNWCGAEIAHAYACRQIRLLNGSLRKNRRRSCQNILTFESNFFIILLVVQLC